ncbi:MAG: alanine aminotransferase [Thermoplasmata archaeon]|nr:MAG: aminotransferase class I/II-fold pyridoxal phosphate-dependent enzyme [Thermoplasmata archaeon]RLF33061.1 MAG: alanine aminotransferase [Thermoplasmata archaeon]RLF39040.1 MAG: alanine aminotransferase [Thermoplasmata archaeon]RLF61463.1 MAG: alanine aminotransferase [Thermoplasmata archaeon]HDN50991.1 aminotransferase class I/II-fold pyridoxal phosphate-dependent enzyme [Thermoplasmatales archaeon]
MITPSERTRGISYAIREVVVYAKQLEAKGIHVLKMNIGDPIAYDFDTPKHMKDALYRAALEGHNGYAPSEGYQELREEIAKRERRRNGMDYRTDDICITTGVTESLQMFLSATLNEGDELLVPGPTYPPYNLITAFNGAKSIPYATLEEEGWQPDIDDIRKKITEKTKAVVIINPNNPTGALYSAKVVKEIVDIAAEHHIVVVSDEIYDDIVFDGKHHATASLAKDVPMITFNGFSKVYLVPGWRVGYALFNNPNGELDRLQDAFMRIARARLCANSVCQLAMVDALRGDQSHIPQMVEKLRKRRDYAYKRINEIEGLSTARPQGAFYIFPRIERSIWKDDKEFVLDVLNEAHVLLVHGSGFCSTFGRNHFRAVILPPIELMEKAFNKLDAFMKKRLSQ